MARQAKVKFKARVSIELSRSDNGLWFDISYNGAYCCTRVEEWQLDRMREITGLEVKDMRGSRAVKKESEA